MEKSFNVKCIKGNEGTISCSLQFCKQPSIMCSNTNCQCRKKHSKCMTNLSLSDIWIGLRDKGNRDLPILIQTIEWYKKQSKKFQIEIAQLQKKLDSLPILSKEQMKLFTYLKQGQSKQITAYLVNQVISSIYHDQNEDTELLLSRLKKSLDTKSKQINELIELIRSPGIFKKILVKPSEFKLSPTLHHNNICIVNDSIKWISNGGGYKIALLQPSIEGNKKVRFKVACSDTYSLYFGICQLNGTDSKKDRIDYQQIHCVLLRRNIPKQIFYCKSKEIRRVKEQIDKIDTKDIIQIQYYSNIDHVLFRNVSKNTETQIVYNKIKTQPLYFAFMGCYEKTEIKLLSSQ